MFIPVELAIPVYFSALCNQCKQRLEGTDKNFQLREKLWPGAAKTNVCRQCVVLSSTCGRGVEPSPKAMRVWKSGVKFAFGRKNKGKVGILSQLKKPNKFNDVHP